MLRALIAAATCASTAAFCARDTAGTCNVLGCWSYRHAMCDGGKCLCPQGYCADGGQCYEHPDYVVEQAKAEKHKNTRLENIIAMGEVGICCFFLGIFALAVFQCFQGLAHGRTRLQEPLLRESLPADPEASGPRVPQIPMHHPESEQSMQAFVSPRSTASLATSIDSAYLSGHNEGDAAARCYLFDTVFQLEDGEHVFAGELREGAKVRGHYKVVKVQDVVVHPEACQEVVCIDAGHDCLNLIVTPSHRIVIELGSSKSTTCPAGQLKVRSKIMTHGGAREVVSIQKVAMEVSVVQIKFEPDQPVLAFSTPSSYNVILSKGHRDTRRGGQTKSDAESVAATEFEWVVIDEASIAPPS